MKAIYICVAVIAMGLSSCSSCDDPVNVTCPNYNPCYGQKEVSAQFTIQSISPNEPHWVTYNIDTNLPGSVGFTAEIADAQYEWHIGSGVYTKRQFSLSFFGQPDGAIPVMLIVRKAPNTKCFPHDDGVDTVIRNLYIRAKPICRVYGTYRGIFQDEPQNPFTIHIEKKLPPPWWYQFVSSSGCSDSTMVQTSGWPIKTSGLSTDYPCKYNDVRELIFNVPGDTSSEVSTFYPVCVALLDSTENNISIKIIGTNRPTPKSVTNFYKTFFGKRL